MALPAAALTPDAVIPIAAFGTLAAAFAVKHYLADFVLQTNWIARGKERRDGWVVPLATHALAHAVLALTIILVARPQLWWLAALDFVVHVLIDRAKTVTSQRCRWQPNQARFWWLLGFDQLLHQLTNLALAAAILLL